MSVNPSGEAIPMAQGGAIRILAVASPERSRFLPDTPTLREQGYDVSINTWTGIFMPAKTPAGVIASAAEGIHDALREPDVRDVWQKAALSAESSTPAALQRALRAEYDFWGPIIRESGFTPEA